MPSKRCTKCGEVKDVEMFNKRKDAADGLRYECRECHKKESREFFQQHRDEIKAKYSTTLSRGKSAWRKRNPEAFSAHNVVSYAIRRGRLPRASALSCVRCGAQATHYHHHNGYSEEHRMDVVPVCHTCHRAIHSDKTNKKKGLTREDFSFSSAP